MFKKRAIFLLIASAVLIPLIFVTTEIISLATLVFLFILAQAVLIYLFYKEEEAKLEQWYAFWSGLLGLGFLLVLVLVGKNYLTETLGLILFLIFFVGLLIMLFKGKLSLKMPEEKKEKKIIEIKEEDVEDFRKKDELEELVEFFEPDAKSGIRIVDVEEPKIEKIVYDTADYDEKPKKKSKKDYKYIDELEEERKEEEEESFGENLPKSIVFDYDEEKTIKEAKVKELKEAPKINFEKVKHDLDRIDEGVKNISEKIKLIGEKAILEGAENKIRELQRAKQPKPKKSEIKVFASKKGTKFHYKRNCLGLGRVKNKDLVTYTNSNEARKKGLKTCGMCK